MKKGLLRHLRTAGVAVILAIVISMCTALPVFAINNPDSPTTIGNVEVYQDILETGDLGVLLDFHTYYATLPTETCTEAFIVAFCDADGTTRRKTIVPYSLLDKGYHENLAWIYFTKAEVTTWTIAYASMALYRVEVYGNPALTWNPGPAPQTYGTLDTWNTTGDAHVLIALDVVAYGTSLEATWALDMVQNTSVGNRLTEYGEAYFENVINNAKTICPNAFYTNIAAPIREEPDYTTGFGATMTNGPAPAAVTGSPITFADKEVTGIADAGAVTTLDDAALTQKDDYWNGAMLTITKTTDGAAPQGQTRAITDFAAATDRLTFAAFTAAVDTGDEYLLCAAEYGVADAGTATTLDDAMLDQGDDYWNGARLVIISTTDGAAPQSESALITDFTASTNRLTFGALTAAAGQGDTYTLILTDVTVTGVGTFTLELASGTRGIVASDSGTVTGSPVHLAAGTNTITVPGGGAGNLAISLFVVNTQTQLASTIIGTGFDLTTVATRFGMSRDLFSGLVWLVVTIIICAAAYNRVGGKTVLLVFDLCIIGGAVLGLMPLLVAVLLFIGFGVFSAYIFFFRNANA